MYFEGIITVDPSSLTEIKRLRPTKAFKKILYHLTLGNISDKEERETFTAVSILQQINILFARNKINNIIRLSHDDIDFYLDNDGKEDDLKFAFEKYDIQIDKSMSKHFNTLLLVLEHEDDTFKYLIETSINRDHKVGDYPIEIKISCLLKEFKGKGRTRRELKKLIKEVASNQEIYDAYRVSKLEDFENFLENLKLEISKVISSDDIQIKIKQHLVLPSTKPNNSREIRKSSTANGGVHYGYHGFDDFIFYAYLWSATCHEHHITLSNTYVEDHDGDPLSYIEWTDASNESFSENSTLVQNVIFGNDPDCPLTRSDGSGWLDYPWGDSDYDTDWGCSSCSSCGGCGGD